MLTNRNILCISVPPWKGDYAATIVELMKVLGRGNNVLYVQNPYTIKDLLHALIKRKKFPYRRSLGIDSRITSLPSGRGVVHLLTAPLTLPVNFLPPGAIYNLLLRFNGWLLRRCVRKSLRMLGMQHDLVQVVAFNPILGNETARKFDEKLLIYHCYDEIAEAVWMKKHGAAAEQQFIQKADAVIVTSRGLLEKKTQQATRCYLVRNAADFQLFSKAFSPLIPEKKTVGYIGSLDNRIDYGLLAALASAMPDVSFHFVGRIVDRQGTDRLRAFRNVRFTGAMAPEDLPAVVRGFSAGLIPFVLNDFTKGIYPLKINEYLAAGIPVISTHFSYLDDFSGLISVAEDAQDFKEKLAAELATDTVEKKHRRQFAAAQNTWEKRVEEFSAIVTELESDKQKGE